MTDDQIQVAPALEMPADLLTKHLQARHAGPFEDVGLYQVDATAGDLKVWQAYHQREHRVYPTEHDHFHRGEGDDSEAEKATT